MVEYYKAYGKTKRQSPFFLGMVEESKLTSEIYLEGTRELQKRCGNSRKKSMEASALYVWKPVTFPMWPKVKMSGNVMGDEWGWGEFEFYVKFEK